MEVRQRFGARGRGGCQARVVSDFYCDRVLSGLEAVEIVHESADVVAYHHTRPFFARAHVVVVPKIHVDSLLDPEADAVLPAILTAVQHVARQVLEQCGAARVLTNLGEYQDSKHLHWHVYAGSELYEAIPRRLSGQERRVRPAGEPA